MILLKEIIDDSICFFYNPIKYKNGLLHLLMFEAAIKNIPVILTNLCCYYQLLLLLLCFVICLET